MFFVTDDHGNIIGKGKTSDVAIAEATNSEQVKGWAKDLNLEPQTIIENFINNEDFSLMEAEDDSGERPTLLSSLLPIVKRGLAASCKIDRLHLMIRSTRSVNAHD